MLLLSKSKKVWSYGNSKYGQTGHDLIQENIPKPRKIESVQESSFKVLSCGDNHSLIVNEEGELFTFGRNNCYFYFYFYFIFYIFLFLFLFLFFYLIFIFLLFYF